MAPAVLDPPKLLTAEEFAARTDLGPHTELVKGEVIDVPPPGIIHGHACSKLAYRLNGQVIPNDLGRVITNDSGVVTERDPDTVVIPNDLGRVITNDSGVVTERDPDTVRGADVAYFSYERLPKGQLPEGYPDVAPELVFEVLSPDDRWKNISAKVDEYLAAGVKLVYVVDPARRSAMLCEPGGSLRMFGDEEELVFPGVLPELRFTLGSVFD
jgi:Uma2 family endonuclease